MRDSAGLDAIALIYSYVMAVATSAPRSRPLTPVFSQSRLRFAVLAALPFGLLHSLGSETAVLVWILRDILVALVAVMMFGIFERWPAHLHKRIPRSVLQLIAIVVCIPPTTALTLAVTGGLDRPRTAEERQETFGKLAFTGVLFAPWIAVGAMLRQRDSFARDQALAFQMEKSELERHVSDARLRLLQAQVEPHFLFNTLANIQALVDAGSPQASNVLKSLIAYLRAAIPPMHASSSTLGQEIELARAYLELMQMRMPDRLQFSLHLDPAAQGAQCPPMTILTLVENAVRHGIDPSEDGGRIDIDVWSRDQRCLVRVTDTGIGLNAKSGGLGTGLSTLRERLQLFFAGDVQLKLVEVQPHGVCAEIDLPCRPGTI